MMKKHFGSTKLTDDIQSRYHRSHSQYGVDVTRQKINGRNRNLEGLTKRLDIFPLPSEITIDKNSKRTIASYTGPGNKTETSSNRYNPTQSTNLATQNGD